MRRRLGNPFAPHAQKISHFSKGNQMAGVKGRSGGARPGAGRKPKPKEPPKQPEQAASRDPLEFLLDVMQGAIAPTREQMRAAIAATQYKHPKKGDAGKKEGATEKAKAAASGKFGSSQPPRLIASNGRKV